MSTFCLVQPMEVTLLLWDHHLCLNKTQHHKALGLHLPARGRFVIQQTLSFILASLLSSCQTGTTGLLASCYWPIAVTIQAKCNLKLYNQRLWSTRTLPTTKIPRLLSGSKEKLGQRHSHILAFKPLRLVRIPSQIMILWPATNEPNNLWSVPTRWGFFWLYIFDFI